MYMYFHFFVIISSWKTASSFLWINLSMNCLYPRIQRCFVQSFVENGHVLLEKKMKMSKNWKTSSTTTTENRRILIRKAHFNLWLMWTKFKIIGILPSSPIYNYNFLLISALDDVYMYYYHINIVNYHQEAIVLILSKTQSSYLFTFTVDQSDIVKSFSEGIDCCCILCVILY